MEIKWSNVIAFALLIFALLIAVNSLPQIAAFISTMNDIGRAPGAGAGAGAGHTREDKVSGLICLGLIGITIVAIVKILTANQDRDC